MMNKKFFIYDDLIDNNTADYIENEFKTDRVPWHFHEETSFKFDNPYVNLMKGPNIAEGPQFVHLFYDWKKKLNSNWINYPSIILKELHKKFDDVELSPIRIKANCQLQTKDSSHTKYTGPHRDYDDWPHIVVLYYINDSDGDTILFEEVGDELQIAHRITPKKGKAVIFNGLRYHCSSRPSKGKRVVINYNVI